MKPATWVVAADDPAFAGHFPGHPIIPGVLLLDFAVRALPVPPIAAHGPWRISSAKFQSPVGPGEELVCSFETRPNGSIDFRVHSAARLVASGSVDAPPGP